MFRLSYVSAALGHTSVNVTAQKYIRYLPDANDADEKKLIKLSERAGTKSPSSRPQSTPLIRNCPESPTGWRKKLAPTGFEIVRAKGEKPSLVGFSGI